MHALEVEPGDFILIEQRPDGVWTLRRWGTPAGDGTRSPGVLVNNPEPLPR